MPILYDDSEIIRYVGFVDTGSGYAETYLPDGAGCEILVLTGTNAVSTYADAGDTVAASPDRSVGGKVLSESEKSCYELVTQRLSTFPPSGDQQGILTEGPTEASAIATIGITQAIFFNNDQYEKSCTLSESPAYLEVDRACAGKPRTVGQIYNNDTLLWASPTSYDVQVSGNKGTVTFTWDIPARLGPSTTTKYLQHDGTRWWITGDEQTGDLGVDLTHSAPATPDEAGTKAEAEAMLRESRRLFDEGAYAEACEYGQSPAYLAADVDCAAGSKDTREQVEAAGYSMTPTRMDVEIDGTNGKVTFTWEFPGEDGNPATSFQFLQFDGTRWWITGDEQTGDVGIN